MKKTLLTILFGITNLVIFGQARLGSTATEIKTEYWESSYNLKSGYTDDYVYYITITLVNAKVMYFFNSDKVCILTSIIPNNQGALNFFVELYNKQYVIISNTEWKMYSNNGIAKINLIYTDDGDYYFMWSD